jgi:peptide/nickel transport system ATP-binding protein
VFDGQNLTRVPRSIMLTVRGRRIGMIFQDPSSALNPTLTLGRQVAEVIERHRGLPPRDAWAEAIGWLRRVELRDPETIMRRYPHEVSGGEKQRVVIAGAFAPHPELILFDEPTTALDVITGARILALFERLRRETGVGGLYISHDLALVSRVADRVAVIERGRIVEHASASRIFTAPAHAYTRRLVAAVPRPERRLVVDTPADRDLLVAAHVSVHYARRRLLARRKVLGANNITLTVRSGEILGVVGESGSGKSSLARALTGLAAYSGEIRLESRSVARMDRSYRKAVQIVFQNPDGSLNPRHRVSEILARPLRLFGGALTDIPALLEQVQLPATYARRWPHQLSGGEKQRVAIARAFAARPRVIICDEITSSLDVSVQAAVIDLLLELRRRHGTSYLFITHDLNLVRQIAHRLAVMRQGELVDLLPVEDLGSGREHDYTRALMQASPTPVGRDQP